MSEPSRLVKQLVDERDHRCCFICGKALDGQEGGRHHRKMRSQASKTEVHTPQNLIDVCGTGTTGCHGRIHAMPLWAYAHGYLVHSYEDSATVPIFRHGCGWVLLDDEGNCVKTTKG